MIDNFLCKLSEALLDSLSGILIKNFSDHQPYFLCLKTIKHKRPQTEIKLNKDQSALSTQKIIEDINTNIIGKLDSCVDADPNANYNNRLLYEYGEILTRVSIAVTRACECHANANECQYFSIFVQ